MKKKRIRRRVIAVLTAICAALPAASASGGPWAMGAESGGGAIPGIPRELFAVFLRSWVGTCLWSAQSARTTQLVYEDMVLKEENRLREAGLLYDETK